MAFRITTKGDSTVQLMRSTVLLTILAFGALLRAAPAHATSSPVGTWDTGLAPVPAAGNYWSATVAPNSTGTKQLIYLPNQFFFHAYDPGTNTWVCAANGPSPGCTSRSLSSMPDPRFGPGVVTAPDRTGKKKLVYVVGGYSWTSQSQRELDAYDPATNTWTTLTPMPTRRYLFAAAAGPDPTGTKTLIYVIGGSIVDYTHPMNTVEAYDPSTDTWTCSAGDTAAGCSSFTLKPLPTPANNLAAVTAGNTLYAIGTQVSLLAYDPRLNTWMAKAPMPHDSWQLAATVGPDHRIYAVGGNETNQVEAYDPATNMWDTSLPPMPNGGGALAATTGPDGRIYVIGGYRTTFQNYVEAYTSGKSAGAASVGVTPASGAYQMPVTVQGTGFAKGEQVKIYWDNTGGTPLSTAMASSTGTISRAAKVPMAAEFGHSVIAVGVSSGRVAATSFQVTPSDTLTHPVAAPGSFDTLMAYGFEAYDYVKANLDGAAGGMAAQSADPARERNAPPPHPAPPIRRPQTAATLNTAMTNGAGAAAIPFQIPSNLPGGTHTIQPCGVLSGCGPVALLQVPVTVTLGSGGRSTPSLAFGNQMVGTTSAPGTVTLVNGGATAVRITRIATSGDFAQTNACPMSPAVLRAGATCTIRVTFSPTVVGPRLGTLTLTDSATDSPQRITLAGTGISSSAAGTWTVTGSTSIGHYLHTATLLSNGKVLVAGGGNAVAELYDPTKGTWTRTGSMRDAQWGHTAVLLPNDKVLVAGGAGLTSAELYDPVKGTWSYTGSMHSQHTGAPLTLLPNGKVLVAGGYSYDGGLHALATAELYDPTSGAWSDTGSMSTPRASESATLLPDGKVLVAGGSDFTTPAFTTAELYDPGSGTWTATGSMTTARMGHTATLLSNGQVLVAGGRGSDSGVLTSAELYDPSNGTWTGTGGMAVARVLHTAIRLPEGSVLVVGTSDSSSTSTEIYDPTSGSWHMGGALHTGRYNPTATLLSDGRVLAAGGLNKAGTIVSAEIWRGPQSTGGAIGHGDLIVSLYAAHQVKELSPEGRFVRTLMDVTNVPPDPDGRPFSPSGSALDNHGNLYLTDYTGNRILKRDGANGTVSVLSDNGASDGGSHDVGVPGPLPNGHTDSYIYPESVAFSTDYTRMYVSEAGLGGGINVVDPNTGREKGWLPVTGSLGTQDFHQGGAGQSDWLAVNPANQLFLTNENGSQGVMQVNVPSGNVALHNGTGFTGSLSGSDGGITFDPAGNLWVADTTALLEYNSSGAHLRSIPSPETAGALFVTALDPAAQQVYGGNSYTGMVYRFNTDSSSPCSASPCEFRAGDPTNGQSVTGLSIMP